MGGASEGARPLERDGVLAALVPAAPERSVVNAALYRDADGLEAAYEEVAMARRLDGVERAPAGALADWTAHGSLADVGEINDRSYTFGTDSFSRALRQLADGAAHVYVAREGGAAVGCLLVLDHEGNSEIQMVAVVPEARGGGITSKLLGHALADAAERGSETSTLIATPAGYPVYERAGFEPLERVSMWERRPAASSG